MNKSEDIKELSKALVEAQKEISNPKATAENPHFGNKYASLSDIINATKPILAKNGLTILQMPGIDQGLVIVETVLLHESGEFITNSTQMPTGKKDSQGVMAATTYARRSGWSSMIGVSYDIDDDGNEAAGGDIDIDTMVALIQRKDQEKLREFWNKATEDTRNRIWSNLNGANQSVALKLIEGDKK